MFRLLALAALIPTATFAFEHMVEYRFNGAEIQSFTAHVPEPEDPWTIDIALDSEAFGPNHLTIETDGDYDECVSLLNLHKGDATTDFVIRMHMNAFTMNGVLMVECSTRHRP